MYIQCKHNTQQAIQAPGTAWQIGGFVRQAHRAILSWISEHCLHNILWGAVTWCLRPYHVENTSSRPITEVKQRRARLVLGWVTAWEYRVL